MTAVQPDLWSMARRSDPDTSWQAAADALENAENNRALALKELRAHPEGLTDFELEAVTGIKQTSIGKRRGELVAQGLVCYAGFKRPAPSGSLSMVWKATNNRAGNGAEMNSIPVTASVVEVGQQMTESEAPMG